MSMREELREELSALAAIFEGCVSHSSTAEGVTVVVELPAPPLRLLFLCPADYPSVAPVVSCPQLRSRASELAALVDELAGSELLFQAVSLALSLVQDAQCGAEEEEEEDDAEALARELAGYELGVRGEDSVPLPLHPRVQHGPATVERKSVFQAHLARVECMADVLAFRAAIVGDKKFGRATHNVFAYRFESHSAGGSVLHHDCDDDGEKAAGARLAELLRMLGACGVAVIVSRWFGGTLLGADRFRCIGRSARALLEAHGLAPRGEPRKHR